MTNSNKDEFSIPSGRVIAQRDFEREVDRAFGATDLKEHYIIRDEFIVSGCVNGVKFESARHVNHPGPDTLKPTYTDTLYVTAPWEPVDVKVNVNLDAMPYNPLYLTLPADDDNSEAARLARAQHIKESGLVFPDPNNFDRSTFTFSLPVRPEYQAAVNLVHTINADDTRKVRVKVDMSADPYVNFTLKSHLWPKLGTTGSPRMPFAHTFWLDKDSAVALVQIQALADIACRDWEALSSLALTPNRGHPTRVTNQAADVLKAVPAVPREPALTVMTQPDYLEDWEG